MNKQLLLIDIPALTTLDRNFIGQGFKRFGIGKHKKDFKNDTCFQAKSYKCLTCSVNDIQIFIDIYDKKIKEHWRAPYIETRKRWVKIYNILKEYRKEDL